MKAVIIIPCYNEEKRLKTDEFSAFLASNPEIQLLFVDDGSKDDTAGVLKKLATEYANSDILLLPCNGGKAEAVRQGILFAAKEDVPFLGFWDADLATPLSDILPMLAEAENGRSYVSGCRLSRLGCTINRHWYRHLAGRLFATAASLHLKLPVYDTQCGAKIFARELAGELFSKPFVTKWFFDVEILRRMTGARSREWVLDHTLEYPLSRWIDEKGSKINYFSALKDFIKLIFSRG